MGVFRDLFRLGKAGLQQTANMDYAENLRQSADLAEQFAGVKPGEAPGTHGAATANPFLNMMMYGSMIQGSGRVVTVSDTGKRVAGTTVYAVELDVTLPDRQTYRTVYQTVIAEAALSGWQPGAVYPFRVSPDDPDALMLG
ncbi:hypothetical protein [Luethyella okanaganae]|uniref:Uncharacterized protein n=1 Tax=Luethyella okanaganae TaxID=69372 RepID=A0ABW1V9Y2_9MICO